MRVGKALQAIGLSMIGGVLLGVIAAYIIVYGGPLAVVGFGIFVGLILIVAGALLSKRQQSEMNKGAQS